MDEASQPRKVGRLFVALLPDERVRAALEREIRAIEPLLASGERTWHWNLHLTLGFLGERDERELQATQDAMAASARGCGPLALSLGGVGSFSRRRGDVLWCGVAPSSPLSCLRGRLVRELARRGVSVDASPFTPHVTLFRNARFVSEHARRDALATSTQPPVAWEVDRMCLMLSHRVQGALRYDEIHGVPLDARGAQRP